MTAGPPGPGTPDGGRYRFEDRIATGGMGEVWRAHDQVLGREVAVKVLKPEYADDPTFRSRFETEARNAAALHHPNVASVFDFGELPGEGGLPPRPYLVMELVRGQPLSALLRGEPMPADTAADLVAQAADGLGAAHDLGIVHRDVKPANLLVTPDRTVKVTDFGIARAADAVALTQTGQVVGTPQYLSPEQAEGKSSTGASDIYSLGVVLYECLAGRRPFDGDSPIAIALAHLRQQPPPLPEEIPAALREIVRVTLEKDPGARFGDVRDLATALRGGPVHAPAAGPVPAAATGDEGDDAATRVVGPAGVAGAGLAGAGLAAAGVADAAAGTGPGAGPGGGAGGGPQRRPRGVPTWLPWAAAALAVLALVLVVTQLWGRDQGAGTPSVGGTAAAPVSPGGAASRAPSPTEKPGGTPGGKPGGKQSQQPNARPSEEPSRRPSKKSSDKPSTSSSPSSSSAPASPTKSAAPGTVEVNPTDFAGRPRDQARQDLEALGLTVVEQPADNPGDQPKDTVKDVTPAGKVPSGSTVTLLVYGDPAPASTPPARATGQPGPSATPTASPSGSAAGPAQPVAPATRAPAAGAPGGGTAVARGATGGTGDRPR